MTSPHNREAEESLLGAMLISANAIEDVAAHISAGDFYDPGHGHVFAAICKLHDGGFHADPVTVGQELDQQGILAQCGGTGRLVSLMAGTPTIGNAAHYALIVRDLSEARSALHSLLETSASISGGTPAHEAISTLVDRFSSSSTRSSTWDPENIDHLWDGSPEEAFPAAVLGTRIDGARCISPGAKGLLLAAPESGKSLLAIGLCVEAALLGRKSIYVDFESRATRVIPRVRQHIYGDRCRGLFSYIRPNSAITASDRWRARRRLDRDRPMLVVIDGYNALLAKHKLDANKTTDIAALAEAVIEPWSSDETCTLLIDHVSKDDTRSGRQSTAIGSISKTGLVDYALALEPDADRRIAKGSTGWSRVAIAKDRDGELRHHAINRVDFGNFTVRSDASGRWQHRITMPDGMNGPQVTWDR
jgi:hypothetical protein